MSITKLIPKPVKSAYTISLKAAPTPVTKPNQRPLFKVRWIHKMPTGPIGAELNISSDVIRGYNDTIILYLLLDRPSYGYEISKQIRLISEEKYVIKETTLYSAFTRLEKNGYITSFSSSDNASGKRRTYYQITDAGREYYRMKCEEWKLTLDVVSKFIRF